MFLIPLILTAGLDMSLPEFQPQTDLSGNVIVGSFDKEDPVDVMLLEDISIIDLLKDDVTDNDIKSVSDNDKNTTRSDGDISSNDKVKDSGGKSAGTGAKSVPVMPDGYEYVSTETISSVMSRYIQNNNGVRTIQTASSNNGLIYCQLLAGTTYYINSSSANLYYCTSMNVGSSVDRHDGSTWIVTPDAPFFVTVSYSYSLDVYQVQSTSSGDITGNDMTAVVEGLAVINENISAINDKLDDLSSAGADDSEVLDRHTQLLRAMLLCLLITFLYPISLSIVRNIVGGDSNV